MNIVVWKDRVYLGGGINYSRMIFISSTDLSSWTALTTPTSGYALAIYHSQLVLVGGRSIQPTNKLWTYTGRNWQPSLPPMPTQRYGVSAIVIGSPERLVVAGGRGGDSSNVAHDNPLSVVEVLTEDQWSVVQSLPGNVYGSVPILYDGKLCFLEFNEIVYYCDLKSLFEWKKNTRGYNNMTSFGGRLITTKGYQMNAHSSLEPESVHVGNMPLKLNDIQATLVALPSGELLLTLNQQVFKGYLRGKD